MTRANIVSGFRLIDLAQLASLVGQLLYPHWHCNGLILKENRTQHKGTLTQMKRKKESSTGELLEACNY